MTIAGKGCGCVGLPIVTHSVRLGVFPPWLDSFILHFQSAVYSKRKYFITTIMAHVKSSKAPRTTTTTKTMTHMFHMCERVRLVRRARHHKGYKMQINLSEPWSEFSRRLKVIPSYTFETTPSLHDTIIVFVPILGRQMASRMVLPNRSCI